MTPFDLESLRVNKENKIGSRNQPIGDRRYFLLVTFDSFSRIHYPLSLPADETNVNPLNIRQPQHNTQLIHHNNQILTEQLTPNNSGDTREIHSIIRQLQEEINRLKEPTSSSFKIKYEEMIKINKNIKNELEEAQNKIKENKNIKIQKHLKKMGESKI